MARRFKRVLKSFEIERIKRTSSQDNAAKSDISTSTNIKKEQVAPEKIQESDINCDQMDRSCVQSKSEHSQNKKLELHYGFSAIEGEREAESCQHSLNNSYRPSE